MSRGPGHFGSQKRPVNGLFRSKYTGESLGRSQERPPFPETEPLLIMEQVVTCARTTAEGRVGLMSTLGSVCQRTRGSPSCGPLELSLPWGVPFLICIMEFYRLALGPDIPSRVRCSPGTHKDAQGRPRNSLSLMLALWLNPSLMVA